MFPSDGQWVNCWQVLYWLSNSPTTWGCWQAHAISQAFWTFIFAYFTLFHIFLIACRPLLTRPSGLLLLLPAVLPIVTLFSFLCDCVLFYSLCSNLRKTHLHEFHISYIHTECYSLFQRNEMNMASAEVSPVKTNYNDNFNNNNNFLVSLFNFILCCSHV